MRLGSTRSAFGLLLVAGIGLWGAGMPAPLLAACLVGIGVGAGWARMRPSGSPAGTAASDPHALPPAVADRLWSSLLTEVPAASLAARVLDELEALAPTHDVAFLRLDPLAGELSGTWRRPGSRPGPGGAVTVRWATGGIEGAAGIAFRRGTPVRATPGLPLILVGGQRPRPVPPELRDFLVLPLLRPAPQKECLQEQWLQRPGCPSASADPRALARGLRVGEGTDPCSGCRHYPLQGLLVVADDGHGPALDGETVARLHSLARTVGSVLEHARLYRDVRAAERFREQVLDAMLNGLMTIDHRGRVVFANFRARELLGHRRLEGLRLEELIELPARSNALTRTLVEGIAYLQADGTVRSIDRDGRAQRIPVRINLAPFRAEEGAMKGAVCVLEDRTQVRAMEEELRHLDTLAAIGRFASSLAHELRNPLAGIEAGLHWLQRSAASTEEQENLEVMGREVRRMEGILRQLLGAARPREMVFSPVAVDALVEEAVAAHRTLAAERSVGLRWEGGGGLGEIHADRSPLLQVLGNLLRNAIEVSPVGAEVQILARADGAESVRLEVLDRGPGIAREDLSRLFEPFFSRKEGGTGLGLYVSHGIVQRHGGQLHAGNRADGGARFVLELPRQPALMGGLHAPTHSRSR